MSSRQRPEIHGASHFDPDWDDYQPAVVRGLTMVYFLLLWAMSTVYPAGKTVKSWDELLKHNPFLDTPTEEGKMVPPSPPTLELRGVVVENGVPWFTFLDTNTKKWVTVREGENESGLRIHSYDRSRETVFLEYQGKTASLSLKAASNQSYMAAAPQQQSLGLVAGSPQTPKNVFEGLTTAMPPAELRRVQQVSEEVQQRRAARRKS